MGFNKTLTPTARMGWYSLAMYLAKMPTQTNSAYADGMNSKFTFNYEF